MKIIDNKNEIDNLIKKSSSIFIMGHKYLDLDAIGSSIGMCEYIKSLNKKSTLVINDRRIEAGVKKVLDKLKNLYKIKRSSKIKLNVNNDSLLIIVDTNKQSLLQDENIFNLFENILVIDHHDYNEASIKKGLVIIDENASSTCEMITELLEETKTNISEDVSTILLAGIVLDTNNFVLKTTQNTFYSAYLLTKKGADPNYVQYLLKQNLKKYIERQKVITSAKVLKNIAISIGKSTEQDRREDLARIADTLLLFNKIEASFVIGKLDKKTVGISARSIGNVDVGEILENFGGGGDPNEAGARIDNISIKKVEASLKELLKNK